MILLSDGYLANGSEPWLLPDLDTLEPIEVTFATEPNHVGDDGEPEFWPYLRDPETLARPLALPGTPGLMHRIGGIEKEDGSGNISYDPDNHSRMVELRAAKIAGIARDIPEARGRPATSTTPRSWSSAGARPGARSAVPSTGCGPGAGGSPRCTSCTSTRSRRTWARCCERYPKVLVPEMNLGQLSRLLRAEFLVDARSVTKVKGVPFTAGELEVHIMEALDD